MNSTQNVYQKIIINEIPFVVVKKSITIVEDVNLISSFSSLHISKLVYISPRPTMDDMLKTIGINPKNVDYATPQDWYEEYFNIFGEVPKAVWNYNNDPIFGQPLFHDEICQRFISVIRLKLMESSTWNSKE